MNKITDKIVTIILIVINAVIFVIEGFFGGSEDVYVALAFGAAYVPAIDAGEYYRLFTACFLHFGFYHLISNMFSLFLLGTVIEKAYGKLRYIIIYVVAGIAGNVLTYAVESATGDYAVSAGASGAILGLMGAFLVLALSGKYQVASTGRVILAIVVSIVPGLQDTNIGILAHVGGLIGGFVIALILFPTLRRRGKNKPKESYQDKKVTVKYRKL